MFCEVEFLHLISVDTTCNKSEILGNRAAWSSQDAYMLNYWHIYMRVVINTLITFHYLLFLICQTKAKIRGLRLIFFFTSISIGTWIDSNSQDVSIFSYVLRKISTSILHQKLFTLCQTQVEGWGLGMIQEVTIYI